MQSINFDQIADRYDASRTWPAAVTAAFIAAITYLAPKNEPILEVGIGTGRTARPLSEQAIPVVGTDFSTKMLKQCVVQISDKGRPFLTLIRADVTLLPFADQSFSTIYTMN